MIFIFNQKFKMQINKSFGKSWFTIIEVLLCVVLMGLWLITVIDALQNSNTYLQKTRQKIIAINLAREWVEQVINIRNTNRKKRAGKKEQTRIKQNPVIDQNNDGSENDPRFESWYYIILNWTTWWQQYFYASGIAQNINITSWTSFTGNLQYSLCESWSIRKACPWLQPNSKEWYFFRKIYWIWLFDKSTNITWWTYLNCANGSGATCWNSTAKEFRFCSVVDYIGNWGWQVELCTVLTNFKE